MRKTATCPKRFEYRVTWQRTNSDKPKSRRFETMKTAYRFGNKLVGDNGEYWAPLRYVRIDRREVGKWETHDIRERAA